MGSISAIDELRRDPQSLTRFSNTSFEHVVGAEFATDGAKVDILPLELERRGAGYHLQSRIKEQIKKLPGPCHTGKVFLSILLAHVSDGSAAINL